jgi:hypothetical protein
MGPNDSVMGDGTDGARARVHLSVGAVTPSQQAVWRRLWNLLLARLEDNDAIGPAASVTSSRATAVQPTPQDLVGEGSDG